MESKTSKEQLYSQEQHHHHHDQRRRTRRRKCLICCGIASAIVLLLVVILIILGFTVLKPRSPKIGVEDVKLQALSFNLNLQNPQLSVSFSMVVRVKNPNSASFKYTNTTSRILYHGTQVGQVFIPAGRIGAHGSTSFRSNLTIDAVQLVGNSNLLPDITGGSIPVVSLTTVSGRVNVLNVFKRHATSSSTCNITISVASRNVQDYKCTQKTKL